MEALAAPDTAEERDMGRVTATVVLTASTVRATTASVRTGSVRTAVKAGMVVVEVVEAVQDTDIKSRKLI